MKHFTRVAMVAAATFAAVVTSTSSASAAPSAKSGAPVANPAQACGVILDVRTQAGAVGDFRFKDCVRELAGRVPNVEGEGAGNPYLQCEILEAGQEGPGGEVLKVSYPGYVFYPSPEDPFPALRANNREQCARALYVYHNIAPFIFGPGPQN